MSADANLESLQNQLAALRGLGEAYYDYRGELHYFSARARCAILQAMGIDTDDATVLHSHIDQAAQIVSAALAETPELKGNESAVATNDLEYCHQPAVLNRKKCWGLSVQLYSLRSASNWGIGDFAALRQLIELAAPLGCDVVGLNPLHALMAAEPEQISPYSPSSRLFLNPLYLAIPDITEFAECATLQDWLEQSQIQAELAALRAANEVRYPRVAAIKAHALRLLHRHFLDTHVAMSSPRAQAFDAFVQQGGDALHLHALFDVLDAYFRARSLNRWPQWPREFQNPDSPAVRDFSAAHAEEVSYYLYLQWLVSEQLADAQKFARVQNMQLGLYGDLAVGANRNGSEVWSNQKLYVANAAVGAPPDPLALNGQDWGIPPVDPTAMTMQMLKPFGELLRANMQHVGALRIDHVMSLFRLWWVPRGFGAADGVYVHYPLNDLMRVLRHESNRAHCLIVGEDLGTVPDEVRDAMADNRLYHYNVLLFEKHSDGSFKSPTEYPHYAVATATTHDLPPLKAWWHCIDIDLRERLVIYPHAHTANELRTERESDRRALLHALHAANLWYWQEDQPLPDFSPALARAIQLFLGFSNARLVLVQLEDLIGMTDPVNVPGTHSEHANWQRKITEPIVEIFKRVEVRESLKALSKARAGIDPNV